MSPNLFILNWLYINNFYDESLFTHCLDGFQDVIHDSELWPLASGLRVCPPLREHCVRRRGKPRSARQSWDNLSRSHPNNHSQNNKVREGVCGWERALNWRTNRLTDKEVKEGDFSVITTKAVTRITMFWKALEIPGGPQNYNLAFSK